MNVIILWDVMGAVKGHGLGQEPFVMASNDKMGSMALHTVWVLSPYLATKI